VKKKSYRQLERDNARLKAGIQKEIKAEQAMNLSVEEYDELIDGGAE
jgi:hypothetical protein